MKDIDLIIEKVKEHLPKVEVEQLKVKFPADDDGIWFFRLPDVKQNIQIESSYGLCPFLLLKLTNKAQMTREKRIQLTKPSK